VFGVQQDQRRGGDRADRHGHRLTRRSALKVALSRELPRSASARVAECSMLIVRCSTDNSAACARDAGLLAVFGVLGLLIGQVIRPVSPS
jgi:hypothetical protein